MESTPTPSPLVKHESVSESYPSLFSPEPSTPATMDPSALFSASSMSPGAFESPSPEPEESGDKKPTKKRKSWGQVLPEPKTNLPPRKRAKTEDEKEQRRVERVLRNRRAAQSSRERKRQETEALAQKNKDLEAAVLELQRANAMLQEELKKVRPDLGSAAPNSNSMTLSQPLFPSQEFHGLSQPSETSMNLIEELVNKSNQTPKTINPASISPALTPVPEEPEFELDEPVAEERPAAAPRAVEATQTNTSTTPMTQYPAAVLCSDLQCQRLVRMSPCGLASTQSLHPALLLFQQLLLLVHSSSATLLSLWESRPLAIISMSMRASLPLPPTQAILTSIISLVTNNISISPLTPTKSSTSTSGSNPTHSKTENPADSTTSSSNSRASKTLRLRTLRKILTCNRQLARPLQDATLEVLRLSLTRGRGYRGSNGHDESASGELSTPLPSPERLIALLWAIRTTVKSLETKDEATKQGKGSKTLKATKGPRAVSSKPIVYLSDKLAGSKRKRESSLEEQTNGVLGRRVRDWRQR
ncbi:Transcriptional activator hac1 [Cytospora mali]|uniref:Transcriptional activator hac1 n=1 Tax=Cytospora mali TaxID=578113 RepID=A0A194WAC5_CYTMA|nr:Transcriptional activator hac1 [Valsa mali]